MMESVEIMSPKEDVEPKSSNVASQEHVATSTSANHPPEQKPPKKGVLRFFSISNLFAIFMVWELVSAAMSMIIPNNGKNKSPAYHPPKSQHFTLEDYGYSYVPANIDPLKGVNFTGFYAMDNVALFEATKTSFVRDVKKAKENMVQNITLTGLERELVEEFMDFPAGNEEKPAGLEGGDDHPGLTTSTIVIELRPGANPQAEINFLRHAVTFLIGHIRDRRAFTHGRSYMEVIIVLESSGGSISAYGLLAAQLQRLRVEPGITLTVSCDQMALSGGYMMAALASPGQLLAGPFASLGSIGVVSMETLNIHDALERWGIKSVQFRGGKWKDPMKMFGDMSDDEMEHMQDHIDSFHDAFRHHVKMWRGDVIQDVDLVTSGAYWLGQRALELGLVDEIKVSDEYIDERIRAGDRVLKLKPYRKKEETGVFSFVRHLFFDGDSNEPAAAQPHVGGAASSPLHLFLLLLKEAEKWIGAIVADLDKAA